MQLKKYVSWKNVVVQKHKICFKSFEEFIPCPLGELGMGLEVLKQRC